MSISRINFIGCGRLGKSLATLFKKNKVALISGIVNTSYKSAVDAVNFIGQGTAYNHIHELPPASIYFITTRDDVIQTTFDKLVAADIIPNGAAIVHCSGSLTSSILSKSKKRHYYIASIHPIKSFATPEDSVKNFTGTYCSIEGDSTILPTLKNLFAQIGAHVFSINKKHKNIYHAAGVLANNYLVTLHYHALACYKAAGIHEKTAKAIVSMLMGDTLNKLNKLAHKNALTGPIQRGDAQTVKNHLHSLEGHPLIENIYASLGRATIPLTKHSENTLLELNKILSTLTLDFGQFF
jgi:predicted short-subunit dehydrogenase-like oxidoreductase (DUF2520 family)